MGFKKSFGRRRAVPNRRRRGRGGKGWRGITIGQAARSAYQGVKYLRGLVNSEMFHLDTFINTAASTTPTVTHLTALAQGDNDPGRTGNSIFAKALVLRLSLNIGAAATQSWVRVVLLWDNQQIAGTVPAFNDVFEGNNIYDVMNKTHLGRFSILLDKTFVLDNVSCKAIQYNKYFTFAKHIRYYGANSTNIEKNGLYLMYVSSEAVNTAVVSANVRMDYHDN